MADEQISVFISYAHEDVEIATAIQERLEADGFAVWIDEGALRAGDSLFEKITTAIHANEFVVALITEASVDSKWCQHEIHTAMTSGLNREGVKLLPVRFGNVRIPVTLEDTYCPAIEPENMDEGIARLAKDARSHHEERRLAKVAGEPLPTTGGEDAGRIVLPKATIVQEPPRPSDIEPVRVVGIVKEGVGRPRNDGTRGSALYAVPVQLSRAPSGLWTELFLRCWDRPPEWTTMHRPGIARVSGDSIILDGTTMDELEKYHAKTLRLCVATVNEQEQVILERERVKQEADEAARREHEREVEDIADRIRFDG
ncbi:MAG: toll/interleukin-1 receptor domain-containing protein [Actinomycetota bacterium]